MALRGRRQGRRHGGREGHRLVWQAASLLLAYPDEGQERRLADVEQLLELMPSDAGGTLGATCRFLRETAVLTAAEDYVGTFDLRRRATLYLTYWTSGDTRNRGNDILQFAQAYRSAGVNPPTDESPDHLAVLLEFAATVDPKIGLELMSAHRVSIGLLRDALSAARSPYAHVLDAVCATIPAPTSRDEKRIRKLALAGPPAEMVGLRPSRCRCRPEAKEPAEWLRQRSFGTSSPTSFWPSLR